MSEYERDRTVREKRQGGSREAKSGRETENKKVGERDRPERAVMV